MRYLVVLLSVLCPLALPYMALAMDDDVLDMGVVGQIYEQQRKWGNICTRLTDNEHACFSCSVKCALHSRAINEVKTFLLEHRTGNLTALERARENDPMAAQVELICPGDIQNQTSRYEFVVSNGANETGSVVTERRAIGWEEIEAGIYQGPALRVRTTVTWFPDGFAEYQAVQNGWKVSGFAPFVLIEGANFSSELLDTTLRVPEPAGASLSVAALAVLIALRRRAD